MKKFVIIASQRTGSNMLVSALRSHPQIECHGELFRRNKKHFRGGVRVFSEIDERFQDERCLVDHWDEFLQAVVEHGAERAAEAVGFKIMTNQSETVRQALIADTSWSKILLKRDNVLAVYSSNKIAKLTGQGSAGKFAELKKGQTRFDANEFDRFRDRYLERFERVETELQASGQDYLDTRYSEICAPDGVKTLIRYLGLDPEAGWEVSTKKRNSSQLLERFKNPSDVARYMDEIGRQDWLIE